jgi:hypothetical protein
MSLRSRHLSISSRSRCCCSSTPAAALVLPQQRIRHACFSISLKQKDIPAGTDAAKGRPVTSLGRRENHRNKELS